jgi:dolichol-phosphate mannosyltransferase
MGAVEKPRFRQSISVVLPAYGEEECIGAALDQCLAFLPERFERWEVIVVDDGSPDETGAVVEERSRAHPEVRLVRHARNQGYGRALASGFAAATGELVFFTDADCQFDVRELAQAVPLVTGPDAADAVFGFRVYRYDSVTRCLLSWVYNRMVRVLFGVRVRDVDCSFKLFTRGVVDRLRWDARDFFVDTEMVARTAHLGARTVELGVRHYPRRAGRTTVRASHVPKTLWTVGRMWLRIHFPRAFPAKAPAPPPAAAPPAMEAATEARPGPPKREVPAGSPSSPR